MQRDLAFAGVDCHYCERDVGTYDSFAACYAADNAFKPEGPSLNAATDYPASISSSDGQQVTAAVAICPPATAVGCVSTSVVLYGCRQPLSTVNVSSIVVSAGATLVIGDAPLTLNIINLAVYGTFKMGSSPSCAITSPITALIGTKTLNLQEPVQWLPGQKILLVTTTWKVTNGGLTVTTVEVVQFNHYGGEYQAEVAMLTRTILFTSDAKSTNTTLGPHTTSFGPNTRVSGASFERWGARNKPGKYSLHFHLAREAPQAYLRNNVVFKNLAAYVHPINTAGSGGGQQGTDRWQSSTLFDPSDAGAAGFYALNAYVSAASGGFAGFTFPNAPRAIKDHRNILKPDGFPFNPSERPLLLFRNNTVHSTGYFWEHSACFYFGGVLMYKKDTKDNVLFYNNGRGPITSDPLCPDPNWPASDSSNKNKDCYVGSARNTRNAAGNADEFLRVAGLTAALCNVGIASWGNRIEVDNFKGYDVTRGSMYLGQSWMSNSYFRINTTNTLNGWSGWPWSATENWSESWVIKGFEFYDTMTSTLLSNVVFDNYKYRPYPVAPGNWWYLNTPFAVRMLSHSDQFKPDKTMMVSKGIQCTNCDFGTCTATSSANWWCDGSAFFRVDRAYTGASWTFNWLDQDGSVVRHVQPSKPAGPYIIGSYPSWWQLSTTDSWNEPKFGKVWISPMPAGEAAARVEMRVQNSAGRELLHGSPACGELQNLLQQSQSSPAKHSIGVNKSYQPPVPLVLLSSQLQPRLGPSTPWRYTAGTLTDIQGYQPHMAHSPLQRHGPATEADTAAEAPVAEGFAGRTSPVKKAGMMNRKQVAALMRTKARRQLEVAAKYAQLDRAGAAAWRAEEEATLLANEAAARAYAVRSFTRCKPAGTAIPLDVCNSIDSGKINGGKSDVDSESRYAPLVGDAPVTSSSQGGLSGWQLPLATAAAAADSSSAKGSSLSCHSFGPGTDLEFECEADDSLAAEALVSRTSMKQAVAEAEVLQHQRLACTSPHRKLSKPQGLQLWQQVKQYGVAELAGPIITSLTYIGDEHGVGAGWLMPRPSSAGSSPGLSKRIEDLIKAANGLDGVELAAKDGDQCDSSCVLSEEYEVGDLAAQLKQLEHELALALASANSFKCKVP
eukprot:gene9208-9375_t